VDVPEVRAEFGGVIDEIETRGLLYPVTVIDNVPVYDGAVSYPAILRAVNNMLLERTASEA
jgi:disulfide oxidoreductase YuzD